MKYERFEQVPVWQGAIEIARLVFLLTADRAFAGQGDLANQLQRAGLSISNNVAEGFERGSTNELIAFLYYARGSAGEVRSILCLLERLDRFAHLKSQISDLKSLSESCSRQLRGWADHLQNTDIKGQRHLNEQTREVYDQSRRAEAFREKLRGLANASKTPARKSEISDLKSDIPKSGISDLNSGISDLKSDLPKSEISDLKSDISKSGISDLKSDISNPPHPLG